MASVRQVQIGPLVAVVSFSTALEDIIPPRFLPSITSLDVPWIFQGEAMKATDEMIDRWSIDNPRFRRAFRDLREVPEQSAGFFADLADNKPPPAIITDWQFVAGTYQQRFLYDVMSEVGLNVQDKLRKACQLDRQPYMLCFHIEAMRTKYVVGDQEYTGPPAPGYVCHIRKSQSRRARLHTPIVSYAITSINDSPESSLKIRLQILLSQLAANLKCLHRRRIPSQAQEAFVVAMHGQYLHIIHGMFTGSDISIAQSRSPSKDHRFKVNVSKDYNMLEKEDFMAATRALSGMFAYLLSKEAKVGSLQVTFGAAQAAKVAGTAASN